jgi:hypothetical protein
VSAVGPRSRCGDALRDRYRDHYWDLQLRDVCLSRGSPGTVKRLPDTFKHTTTKVLACLHRGRCDLTTDSVPGRAEVPELRPDEQVSTSEVVSGADAVNGFQHPRQMSTGTFTRTSQVSVAAWLLLCGVTLGWTACYMSLAVYFAIWPLLSTLLFEGVFLGIGWWTLAAAAIATFLFLVCKAVEAHRLQCELVSAAVMYREHRGGSWNGESSVT